MKTIPTRTVVSASIILAVLLTANAAPPARVSPSKRPVIYNLDCSEFFVGTFGPVGAKQILAITDGRWYGPFDSDDGDVLTGWALAGRGIVNKPRFEVEPFIRDQRLKVILPDNPPPPIQLAAVYPHKNFQDPKVRLLLDFMADRCQRMIREILAGR